LCVETIQVEIIFIVDHKILEYQWFNGRL